jgi:hypothetical protein
MAATEQEWSEAPSKAQSVPSFNELKGREYAETHTGLGRSHVWITPKNDC